MMLTDWTICFVIGKLLYQPHLETECIAFLFVRDGLIEWKFSLKVYCYCIAFPNQYVAEIHFSILQKLSKFEMKNK